MRAECITACCGIFLYFILLYFYYYFITFCYFFFSLFLNPFFTFFKLKNNYYFFFFFYFFFTFLKLFFYFFLLFFLFFYFFKTFLIFFLLFYTFCFIVTRHTMMISVPKRNTVKVWIGLGLENLVGSSIYVEWRTLLGTRGKCYIILAGTTVLSGGPNWEKSSHEKNLCRRQSWSSRRSTHNLVLGF